MNKSIIAMIPARIGSTRLEFKNLAMIDGKPLIYYAINAAKKSKMFDKIVLNSDHEIFSEIAKRYKIDFFLRSKDLGSNDARSDDVVLDFMRNFKNNICCWINPIAPLQTSDDIQNTINFFQDNNLDSLITTESKQVHGLYKNKPINFNIKKKFDLTQDLEAIKIFNYTIMMWNRNSFIKYYKKNNFSFFSGKFGTFDLSKLSSLIVKNKEDLNLINEIVINRKSKNNFKVDYDSILKILK